MPIVVHAPTRVLSQDEFGEIAYRVMGHVFEIRRRFGRLFNEEIYQQAVADSCDGKIEVAVDVLFDDFTKRYYLDMLVEEGALFEFKTADAISDSHRSQVLNYLLLTGLQHAKLINLGASSVEHEFVNSTLSHMDRTSFEVVDVGWDPSAKDFKSRLVELLRDWGTCLQLSLYQEAAMHFVAPAAPDANLLPVFLGDKIVGHQAVSLYAPNIAFRCTAIANERAQQFHEHLECFVNQTKLQAIHWINIAQRRVRFETIRGTQ